MSGYPHGTGRTRLRRRQGAPSLRGREGGFTPGREKCPCVGCRARHGVPRAPRAPPGSHDKGFGGRKNDLRKKGWGNVEPYSNSELHRSLYNTRTLHHGSLVRTEVEGKGGASGPSCATPEGLDPPTRSCSASGVWTVSGCDLPQSPTPSPASNGGVSDRVGPTEPRHDGPGPPRPSCTTPQTFRLVLGLFTLGT